MRAAREVYDARSTAKWRHTSLCGKSFPDYVPGLVGVEKLAEAACLSPRQFARVFKTETGQAPAKAIENLRLEAAKFMLEQGRLPVEEIAREAGFGDRERMRRSFLRSFGQTPQAIRNASHPLASI